MLHSPVDPYPVATPKYNFDSGVGSVHDKKGTS